MSFAQFTNVMGISAESYVIDILTLRTWIDWVTFTWDIIPLA